MVACWKRFLSHSNSYNLQTLVVADRYHRGTDDCGNFVLDRPIFNSFAVMSHIGWGGEQTTIYEGVETFP